MSNNKYEQKNMVDLYDFYVSKFFVRIPKNCSLIKRSKFKGKKIKVKKGNWALSLPFFTEVKLVSHAIRNFDYDKEVFEDAKGQDLVVDLAITVKIIDPIKYEYENTDVEAELRQLLSSIMRTFIAKFDYEFLKVHRFELPTSNSHYVKYVEGYGNVIYKSNGQPSEYNFTSKDVDVQIREKNFKQALIQARIELDKFAKKYGLSVQSLYNKSIQQTKELQEAYNKKVLAEKAAESKRIEKDNELELAKKDAEITEVTARAEAMAEKIKLKGIVEGLKEAGMSDEKINELLKSLYLSKNGKANMFFGMDDNSSLKSGIVAGSVAANMQQQQPEENVSAKHM